MEQYKTSEMKIEFDRFVVFVFEKKEKEICASMEMKKMNSKVYSKEKLIKHEHVSVGWP